MINCAALSYYLNTLLCFSLRLTNCVSDFSKFSGAMKHNMFASRNDTPAFFIPGNSPWVYILSVIKTLKK